jgi:cytochrome d ubiquinol oxidase subunit I
MKLAAMEALYNGGTDQGLTAVAWVSPFSQPDYANEQEPPARLAMPYALSFMATHDIHGFVPGVNDLIKGYTLPDGTKEPSCEEKIERGKKAIAALAAYRDGKDKDANLAVLKEDMKYFGYGYIKNPDEIVPNIPVNFWSFRIMVGFGCLFILFFAVVLFFVYKKDIAKPRWLHLSALALLPCSYIASEAGWLVAEFGRQPWTIQDMLPTWVSVSNLSSGAVATTFFIFLLLFTAMLLIEIRIMVRQIKKGPEYNK